MRILVTGATGFIGGHILPRILSEGHEVVALARDESKASKKPWYPNVRFVAQDLHAEGFEPEFDHLGSPEALIHLAWSGLPDYKNFKHFEQNLPADFKFIKSLVNQGLSQVLVTGTCFEYGMVSGCLSEEMSARPANPYALAKDTLRKSLQLLQQQNAFVLKWARLFYMYGPGQNPNSLLAQLDRAIDEGDSVFNMSGGEQLRDYLPVEDVALRLVQLLENSHCEGIFNVCRGEPISVRNLVEQHLAKRGAKINLNLGHYSYPDYEPMEFWGSSQLFNQLRNLV